MEDKLLVLKCKRRERQALRCIYEKYRDDLLILAIALLNDVNAAEDVVHDVFVAFAVSIDRFKLTGTLKAYLSVCVANRARNRLQARHSRNISLDGIDPVTADLESPARAIICSEELRLLSAALRQLPIEQRQVIALHIHGQMSFRAIGKALSISANTIKSRYRYGIEKLRSILDSEVKR